MPTATSVARDLRALGASAPLRAAYEVSKRSGFHRVLFRRPVDASNYRSRPLDLGTHIPDSHDARDRCLEDARQILNEGLRVFGRRIDTGIRASWSIDPLTGKEWASDVPWWEVDIRSDARLSDVKFVWEAARHRDLVVLARAAVLEPDGPWRPTLQRLLREWSEQCPPEQGVHWYSSLELALRAIAWSQILGLVGDRLEQQLRQDMDRQLVASARHILIELPYTMSSMKNNHLLGDGLGLVVLGRLFPDYPGSRWWQRIGDRLFDKQLSRHMRPDGSMIEDSLSYHRFVLEMLIVRVVIGGASDVAEQAMAGAARHLELLGALDGPIPQYGDWDEGRVLSSSGDALSTAGSALLALALSGGAPEGEAWDGNDELAWYVERPTAKDPQSSRRLVPDVTSTGGVTRVSRDGWTVWFKTGGGPSHQHGDLSSVWIRRGLEWIIRDPGTGTYNGPLEVRNGMRTSNAHPVWHPVGVDQLDPHRAFRWLNSANGFASEPLALGDRTILFGWHDAFERLTPASKVARVVVVAPQYVAVIDQAEEAAGEWEISLPLGRGKTESLEVEVYGAVDVEDATGQRSPFRGWHSSTYGQWEPSTWRVLRTRGASLPVWGIGQIPLHDPPEGKGKPIVDGLQFTFTWQDSVVRLRIEDRAERVWTLEAPYV
jgi:hypothetical protein